MSVRLTIVETEYVAADDAWTVRVNDDVLMSEIPTRDAAERIATARHEDSLNAARTLVRTRVESTYDLRGTPIAPGSVVYVESVDTFGFTGRDAHPSSDMRGCSATVVRIETYLPDLDEDLDEAYTVIYAVVHRAPYRYVEFIDHELAAIRP